MKLQTTSFQYAHNFFTTSNKTSEIVQKISPSLKEYFPYLKGFLLNGLLGNGVEKLRNTFSTFSNHTADSGFNTKKQRY
jgi:hypothetical protein